MILFSADYQNYDNYIIDYDTKNESFLRLAALYNKMGVKNCTFLLVLLQPALQGVDPYDPNLTVEQMTMIGIECRYNPWYFFREVARIPAIAGPIPSKFLANRGNIALVWSFLANIDIALIQPRQTGKSVSTDVLMDWLLHCGTSNTMIGMITKDDKLRKENVARLKKIRDLLPAYLVPKTKKDTDNQDEITCYAWDNRYRTGVAQSAEIGANNLGRGMTSPVSHIDEGPFISWIGVTLPAMLASGNAARAEAKKYGRPYGNIFTTTAGKKDDRDGRYMFDMISAGATWNEAFFDARDREHLEELVLHAGTGPKILINATFSHRQLGLTDKWLYDAMANANAKGDAADRDFFNVWTAGTQRSPLSVQLNEIIRESMMDPLYNEVFREGYIIRWYVGQDELEYLMATGQIVLGMDTSEAVNRDAIAGVFLNLADMSTVGAFTIHETNLIRFARFVADVLIKYKRVTVIPERKSTGQMLIDALLLHLPLAGEDPFKRIFNSVVDNASINPDEFKAICVDTGRRNSQFYDSRKKYFGFNTNAQSRELLYSTILQNAAKRSGMLVRDRRLSEEIRGLVEKNGRIDHITSGHDDMVVAWLLGNWFVAHAKNLKHYGIDISKIDTAKFIDGRIVEEADDPQLAEQRALIAEIQQVITEMEETEDEFWLMKLEFKLRALNSKVIADDEELFSIDAVIRQAHEKRKDKARLATKQHESLDTRSMWSKFIRRR